MTPIVRPRRALDVAVMRGGTSRGVVLDLEAASEAGPDRDDLARALIGASPVHGLGGGSPITSKVVLVGPSPESNTDLDYIVGNLTAHGGPVDWSGTCGNMTSAVVPYAAMTGLISPAPGYRLRNLATQGRIDITVSDPASLARIGIDVELTTSYLDPGGSVFGTALPTGRPLDAIVVDGEAIDCSIVDVTHPYLLVRYDQVVGGRDIGDPAVIERIELVRSTVCVALGVCATVDEARVASAAVPRIVLVHPTPEPAESGIRVTAVSMGDRIATVPVTAGMCLAAARRIDGTIVSDLANAANDGEVEVHGPAASLRAWASVDRSGKVVSAAVDRGACCIMRGTAWV